MFFTFLFYWIERKNIIFLEKSLGKFCRIKKKHYLCTAIERESNDKNKKLNGALVQLVRIHACHAWGHGFESRTHRLKKSSKKFLEDFFYISISSNIYQ